MAEIIFAMGLDIVEVVLLTEEVFGIAIPDEEAEQAVTVGDLYRIVLNKLELPYVSSKEIEQDGVAESRFHPPVRGLFRKTIEFPITPDPASIPWTAPEVWLTLKALILDQLQVDPDEVREEASFNKDLGAD